MHFQKQNVTYWFVILAISTCTTVKDCLINIYIYIGSDAIELTTY